MLTFFLIPNTEQFLKLVRRSCGDVLLHLPDGSRRDLNHSCDAFQMLEPVKSKRADAESSLTDYRDVKPFIQYMAEAAL